jgi:outer membrane lipoprotein carrier protein
MLKAFTFLFAGLFATPVAAPVAQPPLQVVSTRVATAPTAADILAGVQKFYAGITGVTAKFRQEVTNATFGKSEKSDGQLFISKPGKMRWNYFAKQRKGKEQTLAKEFISDGIMLYVVDHENKQVIKKDLQKNLLPTAITFLYGKGDLANDFIPSLDTASGFGAVKGDQVLKLTPKQPTAQYKFLYLVVDPGSSRVKESIIVDAAGNTNHFRFYEPEFNAKIDPVTTYAFSLRNPKVKNYRVVDGDAPAPAPIKPAGAAQVKPATAPAKPGTAPAAVK